VLDSLFRHHSEDYAHLTMVAEAFLSYPTTSTTDALACDLRRVKGSSATRAYLRRITTTFERFPIEIVAAPIQKLFRNGFSTRTPAITWP
jgi:hypothetical protein